MLLSLLCTHSPNNTEDKNSSFRHNSPAVDRCKDAQQCIQRSGKQYFSPKQFLKVSQKAGITRDIIFFIGPA